MIISAPRLLLHGHLVGPGALVIEGSRIVDVLDVVPSGADHAVHLRSGILSPGLIDLQINGSYGVDFASAAVADVRRAAATLAGHGVTTIQPTVTTAPIDRLQAAVGRLDDARRRLADQPVARLLGVHLEGPFLSPAQPGAHPPRFIRPPTAEAIDELLGDELGAGAVTMVTLAPEEPGGFEACARLSAAGIVVSIGHSDAIATQVADAATAGATAVTHLFNAQRRLAQREPGVPGAALDDARLSLGLIADLIHVHPAICRLVFRAAGDRVVLVSDAVAATGMGPGEFAMGAGITMQVLEGDAPRLADGTLAGSVLRLDQAVRNLVGAGLDPGLVLAAATEHPARLMKTLDRGRLALGALADVVWWHDDLTVGRVWLGGTEVTPA